MKKMIFMVAAFILMGATASAQFTTSGGGRRSVSTSSSVESKFGTFSVSYNPVKFKATEDDDTSTRDFHGISATWTDAYSVVPNVPVYFEWGIGAQWSFKNDSDSEGSGDYKVEYKESTNFVSIKLPVSLMYKFDVPQTNFSVLPYAGLNLSGYVLGKEKYTAKMKETSESEDFSYFDKEDMGDEQYNRFVVGWHIGARLFINNLLIGIAYEGPVSNLYKEDDFKINTNQINISLGIKF